MKRQIRWAVVGTGAIAASFARDIRFCEGAALVAVCSRNPETAHGFAQIHGISQSFGNLDDLLHEGSMEAIYLATPNAAHFDAACTILKAGIALLVEKPMTITAKEAEELARLARENNTFLMEAMWTRYLPAFVQAKAAIEDGSIGRITGFQAELAFKKPYEPGSRFFARELGGGALLDLGIYTLSVAQYFLGDGEIGKSSWATAPSGVDMRASMSVRCGAVEAKLSCGFNRDGANQCVIRGAQGTIILAAPFIAAQGFFVATNSSSAGLLTSRYTLVRKIAARLPLPGVVWHACPTRGSGLEYEITAASAVIAAGLREEPSMPLSATITALRQIGQVLANPPD